MLFLFDIDGTLIRTDGAGIKAFAQAGIDLFGESFSIEAVEFAGRLDPLIIGDALRANGVEDTSDNRQRLRMGYTEHLTRMLALPGGGRALPGVHDLLARLRVHEAATLGLLTGNYQLTGERKLRACGIDPAQFHVKVWGDHSPHDPPARDHLVPVGIDRYLTLRGVAVGGHSVVVIGDTPHDVSCARAGRCRSLGVATGKYSREQVVASGHPAEKVFYEIFGPDLWLLQGTDES